VTDEEKDVQEVEETPEVEEAPAEEAPAEEAPEVEEAPAEEAPAEEPAEAPAEEPAPAAEEPVSLEEEAPLGPKELRKRARREAPHEAGPTRTPEERAAERAAARAAKRASRSRYRKRRRGKRVEPGTGTPPVERGPGRLKVRQGIVVSSAADKTIAVRIDLPRRHPVYKKVIRESRKLYAHDPTNQAGDGDVVRVVESRPLSRSKRWRLLEVVEKAR